MTASVEYLGELRTELIHNRSQNQIFADAPIDNRGKGSSFSPTDLLAVSLPSCILTIMGIYAMDNNIDMRGTKATVTKTMHPKPRRIRSLNVEITFPPSLTQEEADALKVAGKDCPVELSLHSDTEVNITYNR
jgi:uncharacterized OsmC-like protein